jgi:uncharacterized RDD family membrane protein YckC
MEIIKITTTQNIDIEYEIGGLGERILGLIIDYAIFLPFLFAGALLSTLLSNTGIQVYYIVLLVFFGFYNLLCEVFFNGQSIGKLVMKIRVISLDGARPKFSQYLLRWLFRIVDIWSTGWLCGLITAVVTQNGQWLGDLVAGTVLVRTAPRTKINSLVFTRAGDDYQPVFTQVGQLNDNDIELVHDVIENYFITGNNKMVYAMADKVREHLAIPLPPNMNSLQFLQIIIKDYSHITSSAFS